MNKNLSPLHLVIRALLKLDPHSNERANVIAFIQSCYCGRVRNYDLDAAVSALTKLTDKEQHALIAGFVLYDGAIAGFGSRAGA
jgi:hypothetical protein